MDTPSGTVPASVREMISGVVAAVRDDDARIKAPRLQRLAKVADTAALLVLRRRLNEALHRPGGCPPR